VTAQQLFDQGDLKGTIAALTDAVRSKPGELQLRSFLFETLCFDGAFDRAAKQLEVLAIQSGPESAIAFALYRSLLEAEKVRRQVFAGEATPAFFTTPPDWLEPSVALVSQLAKGAPDAAATMARVEAAAPATPGRWNGEPFAAFRDVDDRTPWVLEVFHGSTYAWLPFAQLRRVEVTAPVRLRDLLWMHANIEMTTGQTGDIYIPALYAGSERHEDDEIRLGRTTAWALTAESVLCGAGHRAFIADDREVTLLDTRTIEFDVPAEA
jgi:type VI secretion system protein ImpE